MSRIGKAPIQIPKGVTVDVKDQSISVKGPKGNLTQKMHPAVKVQLEDGVLTTSPADESLGWAMTGTMRALINNMIVGVGQGFEKKLQLVGVGYRAQAKGKVLNLALGFSHPIDYPVPEGITVETPSQTEIVVKGADKQVVGQVSAEIRAFRPPEPYKGKGVRYADEHVMRKEAKKK